MNNNRVLVIVTSFLLAVVVFFQSSMVVKADFPTTTIASPLFQLYEGENSVSTPLAFSYDSLDAGTNYRVYLSFDFSVSQSFTRFLGTDSYSVYLTSYWNDFYLIYNGCLYYPASSPRTTLSGRVIFDFVVSGADHGNFMLMIETSAQYSLANSDSVSGYFSYSLTPNSFGCWEVTSELDAVVSAVEQSSSSITSNMDENTADIIGAIEQNADDISASVTEGSSNIVSAVKNGNSILSSINNFLNRMTTGYDTSTGDGATDSLNGSLGSYDEAEGAVTDTAVGNLDNYTITSDGISGYATALLTTFPLVSAMLQSMFESAGNFAILITAGFTLTIVCMIIGISKFFVR